MNRPKHVIPVRHLAPLALAALLLAACQRHPAPTAPASVPAPTPVPAAAPPPAAPAAPVKPQPSEMAPMAARSLLLKVVNTGRHLLAFGDRGDVVVSNDAVHWAQVPMPERAMLTSAYFTDPEHGWAVGHDQVIVATQDGGRTWAVQHYNAEANAPLFDVLFTDASHGYAVGAFGTFLATADGGRTWNDQKADPIRADTFHLNAIVRLRSGDLLVAGENALVGVSADGVTWEKLTVPYDGSFFGAEPFGPKGAIVFGLRGNVFRTDDIHGGTWTKVDLGSTSSVFGGTVRDDGSIVLVGADGLVDVVTPEGQVVKDAYGKGQSHSGETYSSPVLWKDGLLVAGDLGMEWLKRAP